MIIKDIEQLRTPSEPLKFITDKGMKKEEGQEIIKQLHEEMNKDKNLISLAAPQIGIKKRIFCIRFNDTIKTFIDPVVHKKSGMVISPETFLELEGKEILIGRPQEITAVYYNADFKYENNKFVDAAAKVFDQNMQLLDGVLPDVLGLVSDVKTVGSLSDLTSEDIDKLIEFYKNYIQLKLKAISVSPDVEDEYRKLNFTEDVINGRTQVVVDDPAFNKKQAEISRRNKKVQNDSKLKAMVNRGGRRRRK